MSEKKEQKEFSEKPKMRQIVIETDGSNISITKAEIAGSLELKAVLTSLLENIK